jgi:hypothetical protein
MSDGERVTWDVLDEDKGTQIECPDASRGIDAISTPHGKDSNNEEAFRQSAKPCRDFSRMKSAR